MTKLLTWLLGSLLALTALAGGYVTFNTAALEQEANELRTSQDDAEADVRAAKATLEAAASARDAIAAEVALRETVLAERPAFVSAVDTARQAFAAADGKVDYAAQRAAVVAAQGSVLAEAVDPGVVQAQTAAVNTAAGEVAAAVKAHDEQAARDAARQASRSSGGSPGGSSGSGSSGGSGGSSSSGGGPPAAVNWFEDMRQRLNNVGGGHVPLVEFDGVCGAVTVNACASPGSIMVNAAVAGRSNSYKNWVMAHELAHIYQFENWDAMSASGGYSQLFGRDPEALANCMAYVRGYSNGGSCSGDRHSWASQLWSGVVAW